MNCTSSHGFVLFYSLILTIFTVGFFPSHAYSNECTEGFYKGLSFSAAEKQCLERHDGEKLVNNNGSCECVAKGTLSLHCIAGSYKAGKEIEKVKQICRDENGGKGILTFRNGDCKCFPYTEADSILIDGEEYDIQSGYNKCRYDLERRFTKKDNEFICEKTACILELKEHESTMTKEETFNSGFIADPKALAAHKEAIAKMEKEVCDHINASLSTEQLNKFLQDKNLSCDNITPSEAGDVIKLNFTIGSGKKQVTCETKVKKSGGNFDIPNFADNFPNNIISVVTAGNISGSAGSYKISDSQILDYRGNKSNLSDADYNKMKTAQSILTKSFQAEIQKIADQVNTYIKELQGKKPAEVVFDEFSDAVSISINVSSFASLLNTATKYSNYELAKARRERSIQDIKNLIAKLLEQKLGQLAQTHNASLPSNFAQIIAGKINVEGASGRITTVFGTLGPLLPTQNKVGQKKVFTNAQTKESKFPGCSWIEDEELFKCTLQYFVENECLTKVSKEHYDIFKECKATSLIKSGRKTFDELYNLPSGPIAELKRAYLAGDRAPFNKFKYFSVSGNVSYLMQTSETIPVQNITLSKAKEKTCVLPLNDDNLPGISDYKSGRKAHISYDVDYQLKETFRYVKTGSFRYLKKPVGLLTWVEDKLSGRCLRSYKKAKKLYQDTFGKAILQDGKILPPWLEHWNNDFSNYKAAGGFYKDKKAILDTFDAMVIKPGSGQYFIFDDKADVSKMKLGNIGLEETKVYTNSPYITTSIKFRGEGHGGKSGNEMPKVQIAVNGEIVALQEEIKSSTSFKELKVLKDYIEKFHTFDEYVGVEICYFENHDDTMKGGKKRRLHYQQEYVLAENPDKEQELLVSEILDGLTLEENVCDDKERDKKRELACRFFYLKNELF